MGNGWAVIPAPNAKISVTFFCRAYKNNVSESHISRYTSQALVSMLLCTFVIIDILTQACLTTPFQAFWYIVICCTDYSCSVNWILPCGHPHPILCWTYAWSRFPRQQTQLFYGTMCALWHAGLAQAQTLCHKPSAIWLLTIQYLSSTNYMLKWPGWAVKSHQNSFCEKVLSNDQQSGVAIFPISHRLGEYPSHSIPIPSRWSTIQVQMPEAPFYWHGLTLITVLIGNHKPSKMWDEITYPFQIFNGCTVEVWEWASNFTPHLMIDVITCPCLD